MSVMIAVRHNGKIALAADSLWSAGNEGTRNTQAKIEKRDGVLLTVGPSCGYEWLLWDEIMGQIANTQDWVRKWPAYCMGRADKSPLDRLASDGNKSAPILVVWQGRILKLWPDGAVFEDADGIDVCGCGGDYALGAAKALLPRLRSAKAVAIEAATVACQISRGCAPPIICEVVGAGG